MPDPVPPRFHVIVVLPPEDEWLEACLAALGAQTLPPRQITLVDNRGAAQPGDRTAAGLAERLPLLQVLRPAAPLGMAACFNRAAAKTRESDFIVLLDRDVVPALNMLEQLAAACLAQPNVAVVGCKILGGDVETIQHLGSDMRGNGLPRHFGAGQRDEGQYRGVRPALSVQSAALAVRNEVWCELGGLDETFWPSYFEVADFCFRARSAQWGIAVACEATVTHFGRRIPDELDAAGKALFFRNRARFLRKHYRGGEWLTRFLADELRWLAGPESRGMKRAALGTLAAGLLSRERHGPQTVQE